MNGPICFDGGTGLWIGAGLAFAVIVALAGGSAMARSVRRAAERERALQAALASRQASEEALQRREAFYHTILEDIPEMICRWSPDGRISYVNDAYCRYFGVSREKLLDKPGLAFFHPSASSLTGRIDSALYREQPVVVVEFPVRQADGAVRWQRWLDRALFDKEGEIRDFQSIGEDITERKLSEQKTARLLEENQQLARMSLAIQEEERATLARELHDELGQSLTAIRAEAECIQRINRDRTIAESASAIDTAAGLVYSVVRDMMARLRPALLDNLGLEAALKELVEQWRGHHPETRVADRIEPLPPLACAEKLAVYRIAQEALTNIAKHAQATQLELILRRLDETGEMELLVRDNGRGMDTRRSVQGFGLLGMRERALAVGGRFQVIAAPGTGTTIRATMPLMRREEEKAKG